MTSRKKTVEETVTDKNIGNLSNRQIALLCAVIARQNLKHGTMDIHVFQYAEKYLRWLDGESAEDLVEHTEA